MSREARTQKARGFQVLRDEAPFARWGLYWGAIPGASIFPDSVSKNLVLPAFARPCPTRPRHGFVESREVQSVADVLAIIAETQAQDREGEVIIMPRLHGDWSGILNHSGVTLGLRNDGATAGHSARFIPAYVPNAGFKHYVGEGTCRRAGIQDAPYIEFVENYNDPIPVQLRDGPAIPRGVNYIPASLTVRRVIKAEGDLLDWESTIAEVANDRGVVVWHPDGSLSSHYAVHAILHKIPVLIDHEPRVGEELRATDWTPPDLTKGNLETIAQVIRARYERRYGDIADDTSRQREVCLAAVGTLHASPQWGRDQHLLALRAEGIVGALWFTSAACLGELRHWFHDSGPGRNAGWRDQYTCELLREPLFCTPAGRHRNPQRHTVFEAAFGMEPAKLAKYIEQAGEDFRHPGWRGSYGGSNWADACDATVDGFKAVDHFLENPTPARWKQVMVEYNRVIHQVHNGGPILTKWLSHSTMTNLASYPGPAFVNKFVADTVLAGVELPKPKEQSRQPSPLEAFLHSLAEQTHHVSP